MYIYGASGHSKVIVEILEDLNVSIDGIFDDDVTKKNLWEYPVKLFEGDVSQDFIIAIGNNSIREKVSRKLQEIGNVKYGKVVSVKSCISKRVSIGEGTVVMNGVVINTDTTIGKHCIINTSASIDHDCILGDFVHISPNATLCGNIQIGNNTQIGAGATILPNLTIGNNVIVGAGAVVTKSIASNQVVVGMPAK